MINSPFLLSAVLGRCWFPCVRGIRVVVEYGVYCCFRVVYGSLGYMLMLVIATVVLRCECYIALRLA